MLDPEPALSADDTQPRAPVIAPLERADVPPEPDEEPSARGCANPLLILFVLASLLLLFVAIVGLAGVSGYRDGVNDAATYGANTRIAAIGTQIPHIVQDLQAARWDSALARCQYVDRLRPGDQNIARCIAQSQQGLSATPTFTPTATPLPATSTVAPTVTPTNASVGIATQAATLAATSADNAAFAPQAWLARAQEEIRKGNYETAMNYLEAICGADAAFDKQEVETTLCSTYETLGNQYQSDNKLSEMVIVITKAEAMNCHLNPQSAWDFTINAAQLYLDAKGFLDAQNYSLADRDYLKLMAIAPGYMDTAKLACQAFGKAGDTAASKKYC